MLRNPLKDPIKGTLQRLGVVEVSLQSRSETRAKAWHKQGLGLRLYSALRLIGVIGFIRFRGLRFRV